MVIQRQQTSLLFLTIPGMGQWYHAYNPSYSRGRDQEDHSSKPASAKSSRHLTSKITITKWAGGVAQGEGPVSKPQYCKKKKKVPGMLLPQAGPLHLLFFS
jgi:hypothetical protein